MSLARRTVLLFLVGIVLLVPDPVVGQTGGYSVTATLSPFFIHPQTGVDLTGGYPFDYFGGWERGADGWLYGIRSNEIGTFQVIQVSPTTGAAQVLYVGTQYDGDSEVDFFRGQNGRLYFTIVDGAGIDYAAPGRYSDGCPARGCVMLLDTASPGQPLTAYYTWWADYDGQYPRWIEAEDTEGAIYVITSEGFGSCGGHLVVKILTTTSGYEDAIVLERIGCDPPFDWNSVVYSDNAWRWSDGQSYGRSDYAIYRYDFPNPPLRLAGIAPSDGVPWGLAEASAYLYGITNGGGALGGGVVFRVRVPSLASPDLEITSLSPPPSVAAPGESFAVTDTTQNTGPEPAAKSLTSYYLSHTGETADLKLSNNRYLLELKAGEESTGPRTVKVPDATPSGMYWLLACADAAHDVPEGDELNNCRSAGSSVTIGKPDLREIAVSAAATFAAPGAKVTVSDTVDNASLVTAIKSTTRYYLSLDAVRGVGDVLLTGVRAIGSLGSGETSAGSRTVTVPAGAAPGAYYVLSCADDLSKVAESNEGNNCAASAGTVLVGWADLVTTAVSNPPVDRAIGTTFTIMDTVTNQGTVRAVASTTRYYLSLDLLKGTGDVRLAATRSVMGLDPGATSSGNKTLKVPLVPSGAYYVLACADDTAKVGESDNGNNCRASAATVLIHP